jgi:hypothetical protein
LEGTLIYRKCQFLSPLKGVVVHPGSQNSCQRRLKTLTCNLLSTEDDPNDEEFQPEGPERKSRRRGSADEDSEDDEDEEDSFVESESEEDVRKRRSGRAGSDRRASTSRQRGRLRKVSKESDGESSADEGFGEGKRSVRRSARAGSAQQRRGIYKEKGSDDEEEEWEDSEEEYVEKKKTGKKSKGPAKGRKARKHSDDEDDFIVDDDDEVREPRRVGPFYSGLLVRLVMVRRDIQGLEDSARFWMLDPLDKERAQRVICGSSGLLALQSINWWGMDECNCTQCFQARDVMERSSPAKFESNLAHEW